MMNATPTACIATLVALALAPAAWACQIPVFRYALERWEPATYEVIVFHRGPLPAAEKTLVDQLTAASAIDGKGHANYELRAADVQQPMSKPLKALFDAQPKDAPLPYLVVRYPDSDLQTPPLWAGKLSADSTKAIIDSPARKDVGQRLVKGESAVWALIECGNKAADDAAAKTLDEKLKALEKELKLPDLTADDGPRLLSNLPVRIKFSVIRIAPADPAESLFVRMLLAGHKEAENSKEPVVYAIFGRGRALGPVIGKQIAPPVINQIGEFLIGECSCQVKEQNPGFDLLLSANWESVLESGEAGPRKIPSLTPEPGK